MFYIKLVVGRGRGVDLGEKSGEGFDELGVFNFSKLPAVEPGAETGDTAKQGCDSGRCGHGQSPHADALAPGAEQILVFEVRRRYDGFESRQLCSKAGQLADLRVVEPNSRAAGASIDRDFSQFDFFQEGFCFGV